MTGTTLPWNNDITGERRLSDCPLKLIRKKKKSKRCNSKIDEKRDERKGKVAWHGTLFTNGTRTGAEETTPI